MVLLAIVAILGVALVAFVAINLMSQDSGNDGGGIPLPTIVVPGPTEPSGYVPRGSVAGWEASPSALL
jgi:hypothetical protein